MTAYKVLLRAQTHSTSNIINKYARSSLFILIRPDVFASDFCFQFFIFTFLFTLFTFFKGLNLLLKFNLCWYWFSIFHLCFCFFLFFVCKNIECYCNLIWSSIFLDGEKDNWVQKWRWIIKQFQTQYARRIIYFWSPLHINRLRGLDNQIRIRTVITNCNTHAPASMRIY